MMKGSRYSTSERAGLTLSVSRVTSLARSLFASRISPTAMVLTTACVEYIIAELLALASSRAERRKKKTMSSEDIADAVRTDEDSCHLFQHAHFLGGGHAGVAPEAPKKLPKRAKVMKKKVARKQKKVTKVVTKKKTAKKVGRAPHSAAGVPGPTS
eukprot:TRINITY_DN2539_c0_g1_i1.p3 TRINITY_DN2539_c0_g1~~TRINITY_DN2539_c0_g1_i1.p3  ORF type:complete len:156 (+),score=23.43 TRINITY_DN2539_c0_g1_i1:997-1464(+)